MYDARMNLANEYTPNTILALEDFIQWFLQTYRTNPEYADIIKNLDDKRLNKQMDNNG